MPFGAPLSPRAHRSPGRTVRVAAGAAVIVCATVFGGSFAGAAKKPAPVMKLAVGDVNVYRVGNDPPAFPDDVRDKVMTTIRAYLAAATVTPLQRGTVDDAALGAVVTDAGVGSHVTGTDRATLVDAGLPKAVKRIVIAGVPVTMSGLADDQGHVVIVTAKLDTTTTTTTKKGKVLIHRVGELVLAPAGADWKISGYTLTVDRTGKGLGALGVATPVPGDPSAAPTTPTTAAPTAPTTRAAGR